ncbi:DUF3626 domain-containing protein [Amycolatopsis sp. CA-230715]|uniref:DUF3626 domain-containing protein n=1 Tax=Amycolatopsis sp. CA-230715 TaxID=2745196 RepID=UPI001C02319B|nr:DUF3626 domain-containing protein [Amycolatopsis sp. CA-230715]QWF81924.1 hypothetical protein HUW46_05359 [Amycolatopsis sp. CA-230715]
MCGTSEERALRHVAEASSGDPLDPSLRVSLNFHPDRLARGIPVLAALARDGVYRSQFETGTSNGGLTAHPGGDRWRWESRIFGTAYDGAPASSRPKYGALNHLRRAAGAAPRFGSAHFRLTGETLSRTTFCYPDSVFSPVDFGVASRFSALSSNVADSADPLDDYVEAQVHGTVSLSRDVEALVLDPCFRGTEVEELASALPCRVEWHHGFRLGVDALARCEAYRGPEVVRLGLSAAVDGWLDATAIGAAARAGHDEQLVKRLWHVLARFGALPG